MVEFEWDPTKAVANLKKHRDGFQKAAAVLEDPLSTTFPDEVHSTEESRFVHNRRVRSGQGSRRGTRGPKRHDPCHQRPSSDEAGASIL
jgi:hypothetical protein